MQLSVDFFARILGALVAGVLFAAIGQTVAELFSASVAGYAVVFGLVGILAGLILTPYITTRPIRSLRNRLVRMPPERLGAIILGIFMGLIAAALISFPLSSLPDPFGSVGPLVAVVIFCYFSIVVLTLRQNDLRIFFASLRPSPENVAAAQAEPEEAYILLDTSVIIDGRITDISRTGFIRSVLVVPNFVLNELQHIADSADTLRRNRGRRGLEVLRILQQEAPIPIQITDMDVSEVREVDSKLVALARELRCPIMTNDYNLNRVAELQGVGVLNINDLANAVKAAFLPGEELDVRIIQEGKEYGQGVGYLEDGTMVVVEDGRNHINKTLNVTVTKVLQTTAGRMIFARP
ncbi:MAG: PIN domain-containing protein [Pseudomonadales bacterium]|nr:PIN domain-containing protein [Anaerolineales bacterium]MCB8917702.1 PIN domain-containing protein [Ardenticatenaceae bacterium]MCP5190405.1 PIN domain-containing protein [Pseudomonadales bacterium]